MKMLVKVLTLRFEQGDFSRGDIVEVSPERFALFDQKDVQEIPEDKVEEVKEAVAVAKKKKSKVEPPPEEITTFEDAANEDTSSTAS
jgi:hypothetical protein